MDNLISREALLNDLSYCAPELWQDEEYIKAKIMKQPAVDAVSVEWLEEQRDKLSEAWDVEWHVINGLIEQWREEQEV